jgi:hypothetical protein
MMKFLNKILALAILFIIALVLLIILWLSTGFSGETDSITHYQIARYAIKYPHLFLDHWGKPLFTILASPFAQFGYNGAIVFNLVCGLLAAWLTYLIAKKMGYKNAWVVIIFTIFTPGYIFIMFTSLTEILFSLVLVTAIYFFVSRRFIWSAVIISLIPFARTEGLMYILLFIPALLWVRQYKALPFLLSGILIFSLAGWFILKDPFWIYTKLPYSNAGSELYGSGSFWYYFGKMDFIILLVTGLLFILINIKSGIRNLKDINYITLYFLVLPAFFGYILAQSFLWWQGMMGVLSSTRFMACILPLGALFALIGYEWVIEKAKGIKLLSFIITIYILSIVIYKPFTYRTIPMKTGMNFAVMEQLTTWLKASNLGSKKAFYSDPMFPFYMNIDPFDTQKCFKIYSYKDLDPSYWLKPGELLIWDAQFTGYEGQLPFDTVMNNNNLRLLNIFTPIEGFGIIGGEKYKIAVFMKAPRDTTKAVNKQFYFNDFETNIPEKLKTFISTEKKISGNQSMILSSQNTYSLSVENKLVTLPGTSNISLKASIKVLNPSPEKGEILLVLSIDGAENKNYRYLAAKDSETDYKQGEWFEMSLTETIDRYTPADGNYKIYVWYTGKNKVYVDDLKLEYMPLGYN